MGRGTSSVGTRADAAAKLAPSSIPADGPGRHGEPLLGTSARFPRAHFRELEPLKRQPKFETATAEISKWEWTGTSLDVFHVKHERVASFAHS
jgi:hypothetical protein